MFRLDVGDGDGGQDSDEAVVSVLNAAPQAVAGSDRSVPKYTAVTLDGTNSLDPDGDALAYRWAQVAGPLVSLTPAGVGRETFTPDASGTYVFELEVDDGDGGMDSDTVAVTATNQVPVASAGPDQSVGKGALVTLDGTASTDSDGDLLAFSWSQASAPPVTLTPSGPGISTFTPPSAGIYVFELEIDDGDGGVAFDTVAVEATDATPVADAGTDRTVRKKTTVTLDGSASFDSDGDSLTFLWEQVGGPRVSLVGATLATAQFTPPMAGALVFRLSVTDPVGNQGTASVTVTATNSPPSAVADAALVSPKGIRADLQGAGSSDPDGDSLAFLWEQTAGPPVLVENFLSESAGFTPTRSGTYAFRLTVDDGDGGVDFDLVTVTVSNGPPEARAGPDQQVPRHHLVVLDATASEDPDGDWLDFTWSQLSGPPVSLSSPTDAIPSFLPLQAGSYTFELVVADGDGGTDTDPVTVEVLNLGPRIVAATPDRESLSMGFGERRGLAVVAEDSEGDTLSYRWTVDGEVNGTDAPFFEFRSLQPGVYTVNVTVDDGEAVTWQEWRVTVSERVSPSWVFDWWIVLVALAAGLGLGFILGLAAKRRRQEDQMVTIPPAVSPQSYAPPPAPAERWLPPPPPPD